MTKTKSTKRALLTSALALLICVSMLIGSTFAWFTDSVTSGRNTIQSGNLDVELYYSVLDEDGNWTEYAKVDKNTDIFGYELWEPGYTEVAKFKVVNEGSLALKYQLTADVYAETTGLTKDGKEIKLSDYLVYGVTENLTVLENRETAVAAATTKFGSFEIKAAALAADNSAEVGMVITMPTTVGNEANHNGTDVPSIEFGINLIATQEMAESDSFGKDYDKNALYCDVLATPETINDILADVEEGTVIGLAGGYYSEIILTQDNLTLAAASSEAVVGFVNLNAKDGITLDNLTFDQNGAKATYTFASGNKKTATDYDANITGDTDSPKSADNVVIKNCTFTNTSGVAAAAATNYAPIYFNEQGAATKRASNITIDNCVFACNATNYIVLNYLSVGEAVITNNTFGADGYVTSHNTINATSNASNWTITGNTFNNWNVEKTAIGSSKNGNNKVTWTITGNEFNNVNGAVVLALKSSTYNADNSVVTIKNNTALNGNGTIVTTETNAENETVYAGHKIALNDGVALVADTASLQTALTNGGNIVLKSGAYELGDIGKNADVALYGMSGAVITDVSAKRISVNKAVFSGLTFRTDLPVSFYGDSTIKNCTFENGGEDNNAIAWCYANNGAVVTIENCEFVNDRSAGDGRAIHFDGSSNGTVNVKKCVFDNNCYVALSSALTVNFDDCDFKYGLVSAWGDMTLTNCTFGINSRAKINTNDKTITMNGCTVKDGSPVLSICGVAKNTKGTFVIDDEEYLLVSGAQSLKAAIDNGATKVMLADGEYDLKGNQKNGLTLIGVGENVKMANTTNFAGNGKLGGIVYAINLENMTITDTVYTQDDGGSATFTNVYFEKGFRKAYGTNVVFNDCTFGSNSEGYALHFESAGISTNAIQLNGCKFEGGNVHLGKGRTYAFTGCEFATDTDFQVWSSITLKGCTVNGEKVTAENVETFFPNLDTTKVTFQ